MELQEEEEEEEKIFKANKKNNLEKPKEKHIY